MNRREAILAGLSVAMAPMTVAAAEPQLADSPRATNRRHSMAIHTMRVSFFREGAAEGSPPLAEVSMVNVPAVGETVTVVTAGAVQHCGVVTARSWVVMAEGQGTAVVIYFR